MYLNLVLSIVLVVLQPLEDAEAMGSVLPALPGRPMGLLQDCIEPYGALSCQAGWALASQGMDRLAS